METHPRKGVVKDGKFLNTRKLSHWGGSVGSFGISGETTGRGKKSPQNMHLTATPSGEVAQTLASITSEQGLNREVQVACLG